MTRERVEAQPDRAASPLNFAEEMVKQAEKEAEEIRDNARRESEGQAEKVSQDAQNGARASSTEIISDAEKEA